MKISLFSLLCLSWFGLVVLQAAPLKMRPYTIDLPNHVLHFSLPEEIARTIGPMAIEKAFDPLDHSYQKNGFRGIAAILYDFNGPFWVGAYGSLKFHIFIQKKASVYKENIATIDELSRYVEWWSNDQNRGTFMFSQRPLNGAASVYRWSLSTGNAVEPRELEIFSLPLDNETFLDVGFTVMQWEGGRGKDKKWKPKAEAKREAIKATIVLVPKKTG